MIDNQDTKWLHRAIAVAKQSRQHGNHPFGAVLVDEKRALVLKSENTVNTDNDVTAHAETSLVRAACCQFDKSKLVHYTLYSSSEPCPMCAGAIFWSGIGRIVYALSQKELYAEIPDSPDTLLLNCRSVLSYGKRTVEVVGPALEEEARKVHIGYWNKLPNEQKVIDFNAFLI